MFSSRNFIVSGLTLKSLLHSWGFPGASVVKSLPAKETWVRSLGWEDPLEKKIVSHSFPCNSVGKESACSAGDPGLIPGLGRSPGEGNGNPLQYPCLENLMDRVTKESDKS